MVLQTVFVIVPMSAHILTRRICMLACVHEVHMLTCMVCLHIPGSDGNSNAMQVHVITRSHTLKSLIFL